MVNKLSAETSPYLLQHADNPVEWYPWGSEALQKAQEEEKPIFLSIGYSACHWCHVMAHESFEDDRIANFMNTHFVNIKVDREERPDLDAIYIQAVVAMTGQGGWPMSVFLTPAGEPFFAGTYFPPQRRYNLPSFMEVLETIAQVWSLDRNRVVTSARQITVQLQRLKSTTDAKSFEKKYLDNALRLLLQTYDSAFGGWGAAPKFPQPMAIEFLLQCAARGDKPSLEIAKHALESMSQGGIYDVIGGGFARYSTDEHWLVPHFEKMLYDNAQLARNYLHAYLITGDLSFGVICQETLAFIARELMDEHGGFFSSLDADSDGEEGKYYLWTPNEIQSVLIDPDDLALFLSTYEVSDRGNFEGKNILRRSARIIDLAELYHLTIDEIYNRLSAIHRSLCIFRDQRTRPATDDKILVAWNAMTLQAFAEAARYLSNPDYLIIAQKNAHFLMDNLYRGGRLFRSWRSGQAKHNAVLEDHASLIIAMLALYQSDSDNTWFEFAQLLAADMLENFHDPAGGFFDVRDDQKDILYRPKNLQDNATPSGNALAAIALLMLSEYTPQDDFRSAAEKALIEIQSQASQYPLAFSKWLIALDFVHHPWTGVTILGDLSSSETQDLVQALWSAYRPHIIAAISSYPPPASAPELLQNRPLLNNNSTAFVCQNFTCNKPVSSPTELLKQLRT